MRNIEKYLIFTFANKKYGIKILEIQEIIGYMQPVIHTNSPENVIGAIQLRGNVITIYDLGVFLNVAKEEITEETCIIIINIEDYKIGFIVDTVEMVEEIDSSDTEINLLDVKNLIH